MGAPHQARRDHALVCVQTRGHALVRQGAGRVDVAYALSPTDLIPDFIPVLGYVDDAILLPGMIWLAVRLIPGPGAGRMPRAGG